MDARTLEALKASIAKWERNAKAERLSDVLIDGRNCPLCLLFNPYIAPDAWVKCEGCPVAEVARRGFCEETPYYRALYASIEWENGSVGAFDDFIAAARAEVDFLKSLLPAEETK